MCRCWPRPTAAARAYVDCAHTRTHPRCSNAASGISGAPSTQPTLPHFDYSAWDVASGGHPTHPNPAERGHGGVMDDTRCMELVSTGAPAGCTRFRGGPIGLHTPRRGCIRGVQAECRHAASLHAAERGAGLPAWMGEVEGGKSDASFLLGSLPAAGERERPLGRPPLLLQSSCCCSTPRTSPARVLVAGILKAQGCRCGRPQAAAHASAWALDAEPSTTQRPRMWPMHACGRRRPRAGGTCS